MHENHLTCHNDLKFQKGNFLEAIIELRCLGDKLVWIALNAIPYITDAEINNKQRLHKPIFLNNL